MKQNYFDVKNLRYTKLWHCEYKTVSSVVMQEFIADKFTSNEIEQFIKHSRKFGMADSMIYELIGNLFCWARYEFDATDWNTNNYNKPAIIELVKYYYKKANIDEFLAYCAVEAGNDYIKSEVGEKMLTLLQQQAENGDSDAHIKLGQIYGYCKSVTGVGGWGRDESSQPHTEYNFIDKAVEHYQKAADMDNPNGYYGLWWLNPSWNICNKRVNQDKVFKLYGKYCSRLCKWNDETNKTNEYATKALNLYEKIANKSGDIYYKMGTLYEFAFDDTAKANEYYKKAYQNGSLDGYEAYYRIYNYNEVFKQKYGQRY